MIKLTVMIVDDEAIARERLISFLRDESAVEITGEFGNGSDALDAIREDPPDILFLDVQIPGINGFQVLEALPSNPRPCVILVTAYDSFAVDAFTKQVVDYLLKPFDRDRFKQALSRAIGEKEARRAGDLQERVEQILDTRPAPFPERLVFKVDGRRIILKRDEIVWVEAESNYSILHLAGSKKLMLRETLSSLENRLGSSLFIRINRSALVNVEQVQELQPNRNGDYFVMLRTGVNLPLSRHLRGHLESFF